MLVDAKDKVLGRLASRIAMILQGKNKATYTPNMLGGDKVVVINASLIKVSANKFKTKIYDKYSGYPSGRKEITLKGLMDKKPERALQAAVKGMLPKNHLGRMMYKSFKVFAGDKHKHAAQKPKTIEI